MPAVMSGWCPCCAKMMRGVREPFPHIAYILLCVVTCGFLAPGYGAMYALNQKVLYCHECGEKLEMRSLRRASGSDEEE